MEKSFEISSDKLDVKLSWAILKMAEDCNVTAWSLSEYVKAQAISRI